MQGHDHSIEDITIPSGAGQLLGILTVPSAPIGLVIFAHGSGSSRHSPRNHYVANALHARGLATVLCDLLAEHEDADASDRTNPQPRFDVGLLADRLALVTDRVRRDPRVAHLPLAYFGASTGAAAALVAASRQPQLVHAIVVRGGRPDLAGAALGSVRAPTLFIVGGDDTQVLELNRDAITRMIAPAQLAVVRGATHLFEEPGALDQVAQLAGEWIAQHAMPSFAQPRYAWSRQFDDRVSAGARLADSLRHHARPGAIVFGLPRGGVPVADQVARALGAPLDVWLVRKLGMPTQPELGMGALAEGAALVLDHALVKWSGISPEKLAALVHLKAGELRRAAQMFRGEQPPRDVRGKLAILIDDGIATGSTLRAAIRGARRRGAAEVIVAAPIAAADAVATLRNEADEVICLSTPHDLVAVGAWYHDFHQLDDLEVVEILAEARQRTRSNLPPTQYVPR